MELQMKSVWLWPRDFFSMCYFGRVSSRTGLYTYGFDWSRIMEIGRWSFGRKCLGVYECLRFDINLSYISSCI
jgi:hypothetical protein